MVKLIWTDSELDKKVLKILEKNETHGKGNAIAPHTVFRLLKTKNISLGIMRVKDSLERLTSNGKIKKNIERDKPRYFIDDD